MIDEKTLQKGIIAVKEENIEADWKLKELHDIKYALDQSAIVAITNQRGIITYVNEKFCEITQYSRDELIGNTHSIVNSGYHSKQFFKNMWATIGKGNVWRGEIRNRKKDGSIYWVHATIVPFLNEKGKPYQYLSIRSDITKQKLLEEEIKRKNEQYRLIAENTKDLVSLIKPDGRFLYASPSYETLLRKKISEIENGSLFELIADEDLLYVQKQFQLFLSNKDSRLLEFRLKDAEGDFIDVEMQLNIVKESTYSDDFLVLVVIHDIRSRKAVQEKIFHLAFHDTLTNLPNRRLFMKYLKEEITSRKYTSTKIGVLFIDIDNFKSINDRWGHDIGDLILIDAAEKIKQSIRPTDIVARLGGDEFIVLLRDINDLKDVQTYSKKIVTVFQQPIQVNNNCHDLTCSIGGAVYPDHGHTEEELIKNADTAMYTIKKQGKNNFLIFNKKLETESLEKRILENALRNALMNNQFYLEYQPKFNITNQQLIGMEALVRWNHPDLGRISPGKFIPLAEKIGLIIPLGEWILFESCKQNKLWQEQGYSPITISVNVSTKQLEDHTFVQKVKNILEETKLDPKWLELEVTESVFADVSNARTILQSLRDIGIQIAIDDFGTGYSSLSYLKHLPIDVLKVDASFIKDIHHNEESKAIVKAVLTLSETLGIHVIAEGVELQEHVNHLRTEGCALGQGYYFSKPLPKEDFEKYMKEINKK